MLPAMTADKTRPTLLPTCATVLKTPPAKACVLSGNEDVIMRLETVKNMSGPMAFKATAGKLYSRYEARTFIIVARCGDILVAASVKNDSPIFSE